MSRTPGVILPTTQSKEELQKLLQRIGEDAGFTPFEDFDFGDGEIQHFGVKGMRWGYHTKDGQKIRLDPVVGQVGNTAKTALSLHSSTKKMLKKDQTKLAARAKVAEAGGLHKLSEKDLQALNKRMELEKKYRTFMEEESKRRSEGAKATMKILGQVGKIAVPLIMSAAGAYAGHRMARNSDPYRTKAWVNKGTIDGVVKTAKSIAGK